MTQEEFNVVFELQMRKCADILAHKKKEYTGDNIDRLSAFKIAAALQNCDPKAALAGMMSKHVVSLYDMCYSTLLHFDMEQWDEKITDCINYLILLKALVKEDCHCHLRYRLPRSDVHEQKRQHGYHSKRQTAHHIVQRLRYPQLCIPHHSLLP